MIGFLTAPLVADTPIIGMKPYNYQYVINNTAEFPDFQFLTSSEIWNFDYPSLVVNGTFGGGYKLDGFTLHAIRKDKLDPSIREELATVDHEQKNLSSYFETAPLVTSDLSLPVATTLNDTIPVTNLTVLLQINNITAQTLNVTKIKTIYYYENGTTLEESAQPEPRISDPDLVNDISQEFSVDSLMEKI